MIVYSFFFFHVFEDSSPAFLILNFVVKLLSIPLHAHELSTKIIFALISKEVNPL